MMPLDQVGLIKSMQDYALKAEQNTISDFIIPEMIKRQSKKMPEKSEFEPEWTKFVKEWFPKHSKTEINPMPLEPLINPGGLLPPRPLDHPAGTIEMGPLDHPAGTMDFGPLDHPMGEMPMGPLDHPGEVQQPKVLASESSAEGKAVAELYNPDLKTQERMALFPEKYKEPTSGTLIPVEHNTTIDWANKFIENGIDATTPPPDSRLGRVSVDKETGKLTQSRIKEAGLFVSPAGSSHGEGVVIIAKAGDMGISLESGERGFTTGMQALYGGRDAIIKKKISPSDIAGIKYYDNGWKFKHNPKSPYADRVSVNEKGYIEISSVPAYDKAKAETTSSAEGKVEVLPSKGMDVIGRPIPIWDDAVVYHSTSKEGFENIKSKGFSADLEDQGGYYGKAVSFTPDLEYSKQFGEVTTKSKVKSGAKILNLNDPKDWETYQSILKGYSGPDMGKKIVEAGYDGLYDAGAGDLFIFNPKAVTLIGTESRIKTPSAEGKPRKTT